MQKEQKYPVVVAKQVVVTVVAVVGVVKKFRWLHLFVRLLHELLHNNGPCVRLYKASYSWRC
jgi:hypothetical protein